VEATGFRVGQSGGQYERRYFSRARRRCVADARPSRLTNTSPDIFTEGLSVTRGATSAGFTSSGNITNLAAGGTSAAAIHVALDTALRGVSPEPRR